MDGILNKEMVVCCFCGKSLPLEAAVVLKVWANEKSEEYQVSGGKIAVRNSAECGIKDVVWDSMECSEDSGMFKLAGRGGRMAADETMAIWFQTNEDGKVQCLRLLISGWRKDDRADDLRVLIQGMRHCASEQRQHPCRILNIEIGAGSFAASRDECVLKG